MANYNLFAKYYDDALGGREEAISLIQTLIRKNAPYAKTILEVACGTGTVIKAFSKDYRVSGLDISPGMLKIAKEKLPDMDLYRKNMVNFSLPNKYDVILCVYNSMNNLLNFNDWKKTIQNVYKHLNDGGVYKHLNDGGVFIFDFNTEYKYQKKVKGIGNFSKFGKNYMIMETIQEKNGVVNMPVTIFEYQGNNTYKATKESALEKSFPIKRVKRELDKTFNTYKIIDPVQKKINKESLRLYAICIK